MDVQNYDDEKLNYFANKYKNYAALDSHISDFFICDCKSLEHTCVFVLEQSFKHLYCDAYIEIRLNKNTNFLSRFWTGVKYIFGFSSKKSFDVIMLNKDTANKLYLRLSEYLNSIAYIESLREIKKD